MAFSLFQPSSWFGPPVRKDWGLSEAIHFQDHATLQARLAEGHKPTEKDMKEAVSGRHQQTFASHHHVFDVTTANLLKGFMTEKTREQFEASVKDIRDWRRTARHPGEGTVGDDEMRALIDSVVPLTKEQSEARAIALAAERAAETPKPTPAPSPLGSAIFENKHDEIEKYLAEGQVPTEADLAQAVRARAVDPQHGFRNYQYDLKTADLLKGFMTVQTKEAFLDGVAHIQGAISVGRVGYVNGMDAMRDLVNKAVPQEVAEDSLMEKAPAKTAPEMVAVSAAKKSPWLRTDLPDVPSLPSQMGMPKYGLAEHGMPRIFSRDD